MVFVVACLQVALSPIFYISSSFLFLRANCALIKPRVLSAGCACSWVWNPQNTTRTLKYISQICKCDVVGSEILAYFAHHKPTYSSSSSSSPSCLFGGKRNNTISHVASCCCSICTACLCSHDNASETCTAVAFKCYISGFLGLLQDVCFEPLPLVVWKYNP